MKPIKTLIKSFAIGATTHVVFWVAVINYYSVKSFDLVCGETSCWVLLIADFPAILIVDSLPAMFFVSDGSAETLSKLSLIYGTLWWGFIFMVVGGGWGVFVRWAAKSSNNEATQEKKGKPKGYVTCATCEKTFYAEDCPGTTCPDCKGALKP